jgi:hypothetical protein
LAISRWPSIWWISLEISLVKFAKLILQCLKVWMICMHLYLIWNIGPHFSLIFLLLDWWELTTSNLGHRRHLASSPLELAHVSLFPDLFTQLSLHGAYRDPLTYQRFFVLSNNLIGSFITSRLIAKNIQCHLLKGSSWPLWIKMPFCLIVVNDSSFLIR